MLHVNIVYFRLLNIVILKENRYILRRVSDKIAINVQYVYPNHSEKLALVQTRAVWFIG